MPLLKQQCCNRMIFSQLVPRLQPWNADREALPQLIEAEPRVCIPSGTLGTSAKFIKIGNKHLSSNEFLSILMIYEFESENSEMKIMDRKATKIAEAITVKRLFFEGSFSEISCFDTSLFRFGVADWTVSFTISFGEVV